MNEKSPGVPQVATPADAVRFFHASGPQAPAGVALAVRAAPGRPQHAALAPYLEARSIRVPAAAWVAHATVNPPRSGS